MRICVDSWASLFPSTALAGMLETPIKEWPYPDEGVLLKTRSRKVWMTATGSDITPG